MVNKGQYILAQATVRAYEENHGIYKIDEEGGIPFSEYPAFSQWLEESDWVEVAYGAYDSSEESTHAQFTIKEIYLIYKEDANERNLDT